MCCEASASTSSPIAQVLAITCRTIFCVPVAYACAGPRPTSPPALLRGAIQYALTGRGVFASNVSDAAAIVRLDAAREIPDLRILCRWRALPKHPAWVVDFAVVAIDPASRGRLTLVSADPMQPPRIDPGYLTDPGRR